MLLKARYIQSSSMAQVMHGGGLKRKLCVQGCKEQVVFKGCKEQAVFKGCMEQGKRGVGR